jgi:hypothetical protein
MKRQILAVALGSLFALPALADGEIGFDHRTVAKAESSKTVAQVRAELVAAQRAGELALDGEMGRVHSASTMGASKTRSEVMAELIEQPAGFVDGETGNRIPRS